MFRHIRGWIDAYIKHLVDAYDPPKPTVYKLGSKKYIKVKRLRTDSRAKGPYIK
jgi:hypothetical protein